MMYKGSTPIDTMYLGGKMVTKAYLGNEKVYPLQGVIPKAIKDAMVLWYDPKRQGATNESMASNPTLIDLSGNGHHATCYNFAWSGMSGIGGYGLSFSQYNNIKQDRVVIEFDGDYITIIKRIIIGSWQLYNSSSSQTIIGEQRIKITNIPSGVTINYGYRNADGVNQLLISATNDGVYDIPSFTVPSGQIYGFEIKPVIDECNITIEQLPLYPHALVSDGVDDYAKAEGLPLLDKERGYTVIAKRKHLGGFQTCLASKRNSGNPDGAFVFELKTSANSYRCDSFKSMTHLSAFEESDITCQTSQRYNDTAIGIGDVPDTGVLNLFFLYNSYFGEIALYSFLLFDRDLSGEEIEWVKANLIEDDGYAEDWYGVEFHTGISSPNVTRIGNMALHQTLPVHTQMKGCLLADDGTVNKYLNATDWTSETRDGSQGQVMVEMPKNSYWKFETDGDTRRVKFSTKPLPGFSKTPQGYVSAYQATVQRSTNKLSSVVNTTTDYRGGNNSADRDGTYRSQLGVPASLISRTNFRNYARNRKSDSTEWNCMVYDMQKLLYWLFVVEYATLNSQKTFNPDKDSNGFAQGGLGNGVTNLNANWWGNFNSSYGFIPCGYTDSMGNGTGQLGYTMPFEYESNGAANYAGEYDAETAYTDGQFVSQGDDIYECIADAEAGTLLTDTTHFTKKTRTVTYVNRYRGIEEPFGHLWQWTDGINVRISPTTDNGGDDLSKVYVCYDPAQFKDNGYDGYTYVGNEARSNDYVKEVIFEEGGEIMPKVVGDGASSTKYFCDYHYANIPISEYLRGVLFGGSANSGSAAGFVCAHSTSPSHATAYYGSRLCFIPE